MIARRPPGWYQDPDDPTRARYWNQRGWSNRRRDWPAWSVSFADVEADPSRAGGVADSDDGPVLEGPVKPVPLPAATAHGSRLPRGTSRLERITPVAGGRAAGVTGRSGARTGWPAGQAPGWMSGRRPLTVFCALVAAAVLMMAVSLVGVRPPRDQSNQALARDASFLQEASAECSTGLASLKQPAAMTAPGGGATPAASASQRAAATVSAVARELRGIPLDQAAAPAVAGWLATWDRYVSDQHKLAAALAPQAAPGAGAAAPASTTMGAAQLGLRVSNDASQADQFAAANSLSSCSLSPTGESARPAPGS